MPQKISLKKLAKAHKGYEDEVQSIEQQLTNCITFDFSICYQNSDGFVIVDNYGNNAPLSECVTFINKRSIMTLKDYQKMCI